MKHKSTVYIFHFLLFILIVNGCRKEKTDTGPKGQIPVISTSGFSNISPYDATCGGNLTGDGGLSVTSRGLCWSSDSFPTVSDFKTIEGNRLGRFTSQLTGLNNNSLYYVRAYATNAIGTAYGNEMILVTADTGHLYTGQVFKGGIIFYLDQTNKHGSVAALSDQGIYKWSAADSVCKALELNGYDDWFLPYEYHLKLMHDILFLRNIGNFKRTVYWGAEEYDPETAFGKLFGSGQYSFYSKELTHSVRAVRNF